MSDRLISGPYRQLAADDGTSIPFYIIPFDKRGICQGPQTRQHLLDDAASGGYTDIFLFSHGWNNDWQTAVRGYTAFQRGFAQMRRQRNLPMPNPYRPLLIGIFWPSTALVSSEAEVGPGFAAGDPDAIDDAVAQERNEVSELAAEMTPRQATRFYDLIQQQTLNEAQVLELAGLALEIYGDTDDDLQIDEPVTPDDLVKLWFEAAAALGAEEEPDDFTLDEDEDDDFGVADSDDAMLDAAGGFENLNPRNIVRMLTVYQMKDRAGTVGALGVGPLLNDLLEATDAHAHLLGHSYGAKVVLSALCGPAVLRRPVDSALLLQPAVNHLCFAASVGRTQRPGGYHKAPARVRLPILSTFSDKDSALHDLFHLALRRNADLGELRIAAGAGEPPSRFAALGGYGPREAGQKIIPIHDAGDPYDLTIDAPVIGLDGARTIGGHGGISNESTWWALYELVGAAHK